MEGERRTVTILFADAVGSTLTALRSPSSTEWPPA
jgi:class 3 adenylate cyclase